MPAAQPSAATIRDEDGIPLRAGNYITFTFGIPPVGVLARLEDDQGELWVEVVSPADVKPKRSRLTALMRMYQVYKASTKRVQAALRTFDARDTKDH